jgi:cytochrome P450
MGGFDSDTKIVCLGGRLMRQEQGAVQLLGVANRDPRVFDRPDHHDITRHGPSLLAFGHGMHHYLGPSLALRRRSLSKHCWNDLRRCTY